jgi:molybdenum cofactor biosynthesis protein B
VGSVKRRRPVRAPAAPRGAHAQRLIGERPVACGVLTVSDTRRGRADTGGARAEQAILAAGHAVIARAWCADERAAIRRSVRSLLARRGLDALIVTGGTGIAPCDVTPEAIEPLFERRLPGFGEIFRMLSFLEIGPAAWLSRADAGIVRGRLVVLLPGSPAAVALALERVLLPELAHAVRTLGRFSNP